MNHDASQSTPSVSPSLSAATVEYKPTDEWNGLVADARSELAHDIAAAVTTNPVTWRLRESSPHASSETTATACGDLQLCVLLAGGLAPSTLVKEAGCSVLDLWLAADDSLLSIWRRTVTNLQNDDSEPPLAIRIGCSPDVPAPWLGGMHQNVTVEYDANPLRGPAGSVRDLCRDLPADASVLIVEAARFPSCSLECMLDEHVEQSADVTVAVNPDDSPAGAYIVRVEALRTTPTIGFTDLKEQWLQRVAQEGANIVMHHLPAAGLMPLQTREQFLAASHRANRTHMNDATLEVSRGRLGPQELRDRRIICREARVSSEATVVDSIVMPGSIVESGASVVRSLICPGTRVQRGTDIADRVFSAQAFLSDEQRRSA